VCLLFDSFALALTMACADAALGSQTGTRGHRFVEFVSRLHRLVPVLVTMLCHSREFVVGVRRNIVGLVRALGSAGMGGETAGGDAA
jgi:hypothetical protein